MRRWFKSSQSTLNDTQQNTQSEFLQDMPITEHLVELRRRMIYVTVVVGAVFLALVGYSRQLYDWVSAPLVALLPDQSTMIATDITSNFMAPLKLSLVMAVFLCMPFILYQIWAFIAPALYRREKKAALPILVSSVVLFYAGVAFAYYVVLQGALRFFIQFAPTNVLPMTDIQSYLNFVVKLMMIFGVTFEIPIAVLLLVLTGVTTHASLAAKRRYVVVGCFALAGVLSPPDVATMILLAIPMLLLFELGLLLARVLVPNATKAQSSKRA